MQAIKRILHGALKRLGYRIVRIEPDGESAHGAGLRAFFSMLKQHGFAPSHVLDVGANRGPWAREAIRFFPDAWYPLVEPQDNLKS
jgi:hypothetical protein